VLRCVGLRQGREGAVVCSLQCSGPDRGFGQLVKRTAFARLTAAFSSGIKARWAASRGLNMHGMCIHGI